MSLYDIDRETLYGKGYSATISALNIDTVSEYALLLLKNPSSNGAQFLITHFNVYLDSTVTDTIVSIYANPTITSNGTSLTARSAKITESPPSATAEVYRSSTASAFGGLLSFYAVPANHSSQGHNRTFIVDPGNSLLVTVKNSIISIPTYFQIYWVEV